MIRRDRGALREHVARMQQYQEDCGMEALFHRHRKTIAAIELHEEHRFHTEVGYFRPRARPVSSSTTPVGQPCIWHATSRTFLRSPHGRWTRILLKRLMVLWKRQLSGRPQVDTVNLLTLCNPLAQSPCRRVSSHLRITSRTSTSGDADQHLLPATKCDLLASTECGRS
jgi:hypothetical protein